MKLIINGQPLMKKYKIFKISTVLKIRDKKQQKKRIQTYCDDLKGIGRLNLECKRIKILEPLIKRKIIMTKRLRRTIQIIKCFINIKDDTFIYAKRKLYKENIGNFTFSLS
ncbi:unnamed protein product [Paramecium sonneborni]|uniref:Uncharacterized protein n=1 Tax=Paramecium sonneborni TaxID=65129 RepID=A0A8S1N509_9CILI|nr:unnamed protein product [Paramecium sonneborni]